MEPIVPIDLGKTAKILGISKASVRNWIRHEYLKPIDAQGKFFDQQQILILKEAITNGDVDRLKTRANKTRADKTFLPVEYVLGQENRKAIIRLVNHIRDRKIDSGLAILILAIKCFIENKDILSTDVKEILCFPHDIFTRKNVYRELKSLFLFINEGQEAVSTVTCEEENIDIEFLISFPLPEVKDILGLVYQSLIHEGTKSNLGSYFTPTNIVSRMVRENIRPDYNVLDPCCGTGQFLLSFADFLTDPEKIWGIDIDPMAVHIARLNLLLKFPQDFQPRIYHLNTLQNLSVDQSVELTTSVLREVKFDFIATNPPWGAGIDINTLNNLRKKYLGITSGESFSYFLEISLDLLKEEGVLSFVLPESILNVKTHGDIRQTILENCKIITIEGLGKVFRNVLSPAIILELVKTKPADDHEVVVRLDDRECKIRQKRFEANQGNVFDIHISVKDEDILRKVYATRHVTLKNRAEWALGIVTGDNKRYLSAEQHQGYEPIFKGSDVDRYILKKPSYFIDFRPEKFQQVASEEKYRAREKLIYRFISRRLIFAYEDKGSLTLNSANILIPRLNNYPIKVIMALFNSTLYDYIYQKKFNTIKVLRGNLEQLPLPLWDEETLAHISGLVDRIMGGENQNLLLSLDDYIMKQFGFSEEERVYMEETRRAF